MKTNSICSVDKYLCYRQQFVIFRLGRACMKFKVKQRRNVWMCLFQPRFRTLRWNQWTLNQAFKGPDVMQGTVYTESTEPMRGAMPFWRSGWDVMEDTVGICMEWSRVFRWQNGLPSLPFHFTVWCPDVFFYFFPKYLFSCTA